MNDETKWKNNDKKEKQIKMKWMNKIKIWVKDNTIGSFETLLSVILI